AMVPLSLNDKQKLILAAMLMLSHALPQEGAIVARAKGKVAAVTAIRVATAIAMGLLLSLVL
ncbi:MAG TPA: nucleoside recognition protein, partial [bacterium]|nr:nucleoside recognition protein [bacterium]